MSFNASKLEESGSLIQLDHISKEITKNIFLRIKDEHKLHKNNLIYELPCYFEQLALIYQSDQLDIKDVRIIIWSQIIEELSSQKFECQIDIDERQEKCFLFISWKTTFDKYKNNLNKYKDILSKHLVKK
jgi:hypothetical protein